MPTMIVVISIIFTTFRGDVEGSLLHLQYNTIYREKPITSRATGFPTVILLRTKSGEESQMVHSKGKYISQDNAEAHGEEHPFPGVRFTLDYSQGGYARHVKQAKDHE